VDSPAQDGKSFDIIGFDPRGIGYSTPKLECFPDYRSRLYWESQSKAEGFLGSSDIAFDAKWSRWQSLARSCMARAAEEGEESIAYYMNTTPLAADLVELVERHGEWREEEARTLISRSKGGFQWFYWERSPRGDSHAVPNRCKWRKCQERLLYWGLSYGTVIGQ
jgi:pimeloyl-ACP methyl ester carboxylesterase